MSGLIFAARRSATPRPHLGLAPRPDVARSRRERPPAAAGVFSLSYSPECRNATNHELVTFVPTSIQIAFRSVAAIGAGDAFFKGRDFAAWLGLVPRQMSTGDRSILGPISKRGNRYMRPSSPRRPGSC
jgi:hypothetical protein